MKVQYIWPVISSLAVAIGIWASHAVAQAPAPRNVSATPAALRLPRHSAPGLRLPELDAEDLLAKALSRQQPLRAGRISDFSSVRVTVGANANEALGEIATRAFAEQAIAAAELARLPAFALRGAPEIVDEAYELPHSYLLSRAVRFTVDDAARVAARKGPLADLVGVVHPRKRSVGYNQLRVDQRRGVDEFMRREALLLPANDPLRRAASQGRDALLRAVRAGHGSYEILDTIEVPKRPPPVVNGVPQVHAFQDGVFNFNHTRPVNPPRLRSFLDLGAPGRDLQVRPLELSLPEPPPLLPTPEESVGGMHGFSSEFLAGFTKSKEWRWERRWNYPSGFFRATFGAGYRFGVRIPIAVRGTLSPDRIARRALADRRDPVTTRLTVGTLDANADFYRATGLPRDEVHDGKELLLGAYVLYGWKFRALWTDIAHRPYTEIEIDADADFRPPFGRCGDDCGLDIWFPTEMTQTRWNIGVGEVAARLGLHLTGEGSVRLDYTPLLGDQAERRRRLSFGGGQLVSEQSTTLLPFRDSGAEKFGFRLGNPRYEVDLVMIPQLRVEATLEADWLDFRKTFRTDPIRLNAARIPLGSVELGRHAGTRSEVSVSAGVKSYRKLEEPHFPVDNLRQSLDVGLLVAGGDRANRQVRGRFLSSGGPGTGNTVRAVSPELDARARFRLIPKPNRHVVVQRQDGQYWELTPRGIRASASEARATKFKLSFLEESGLHVMYDPRGGVQWVTLDGERLTAARPLASAVKFRIWRAP